ncbi:hypothetical protein TSUD_280260 [Trifolium subterraneum]|uniref:Uncharacterized protein n=1 Tax=Trifolium subterraneum TaxID=3900 RepID=A0A2Z6PPN0_TRISU|nr:hypothetical protein TSUD_280260 [Trifolium subterraneum]
MMVKGKEDHEHCERDWRLGFEFAIVKMESPRPEGWFGFQPSQKGSGSRKALTLLMGNFDPLFFPPPRFWFRKGSTSSLREEEFEFATPVRERLR